MKPSIRALALAIGLSALAAPAALAWPDDTHPQLSSIPAGIVAGGTWTVDVSFVSQGRILANVDFEPVLTIQEVASGASASFTAQPTAVPGIFRADVVFPSAGSWSYTVAPNADGPSFAYPAVDIGPPAGAETVERGSATGPGASLWQLAVLGAALLGLVGLGLLVLASRGAATRSLRPPR